MPQSMRKRLEKWLGKSSTMFQSLVVWGQLILVRDGKNKIGQELLVS
jgi:hypothetical protein